MKKASLFILLAAFIGMSAYAQKRPFTIADLYGIRNVGAPEFSPDGSRIAFTLRSDSLSAGSSRSNLYVIGGEPRAITTFSMGANDSRWLPDGKHVVFTSDVFPECGANSDCNKKNDESISSGPLQAHMADHLLYRHWTSWKDGTRTHTFLASTTSSEITDLTPGDADAPGFSLGGGGFDISPDGKELCVVSNHDTVEARSTNSDLWIIPTDGRPGINITAENHGSDTDPAYSPDGRFIAYRTQATPGYESDLFRLALYDRKTKTRPKSGIRPCRLHLPAACAMESRPARAR